MKNEQRAAARKPPKAKRATEPTLAERCADLVELWRNERAKLSNLYQAIDCAIELETEPEVAAVLAARQKAAQ